jgi:hypothetical protein
MEVKNEIGADGFPFELPDILTISVSDRRPSNYMLEGNGETGEGVPIDTSTAHKIKRISNLLVLNADNRWEVKQIRYIQGCPTIWVHEQEALKYKSSNPQMDGVWIENGALSFGVQGYNIQKAMFLMLHENNTSFTPLKTMKRPDGALDMFFVIDNKMNADKEVSNFDYEMEALKYLDRLRIRHKSGKVEYNENVLEFLTSLFKITRFESGYGSETFLALRAKLNEDPKKFLEIVGDYEAVVQADVNRAIQTKAISIDEQTAYFTADKHVFLTFEKVRMGQGEQLKAVLDFMLNPVNREVYHRLRSVTTKAMNKGVEVITD